jgi:hypothetical protein
VQAWTLVNAGSFEHPRATSYIRNDFTAMSSQARVSADIAWNGRFFGAGVAGARAASTITLQVLDNRSRVIASEVVHEKEFGESALTGGTIADTGSRSSVLDARLTPGASYQVRLVLTCESDSGLFAVVTACSLRWTRLEVLWG